MRLTASSAALALSLAAASVGCGRAGEVVEPRAPAARAPRVVTAAPKTYGGDPKPPLASDASTVAARTLFEGLLPLELRGHLKSDGWLDFAARAVAEMELEGEERPSRSTFRWTLWRAGVTAVYDTGYANAATQKAVTPGASTPRGNEELDADVLRFVKRLTLRSEERIYGIARSGSGGDATSQAILVAALPVEVEPFAKSWAPGSDVTITLRDLRGHVAPMLYADLGAEVKTLVMQGRAPGASITFKAPTTPGRMMIEVRAERRDEGARAQVTVLQVPLWVGVPEAASARELLGPPAAAAPSVDAMALAIQKTYDGVRARAGVGPFAADPRLAQLAANVARRAAESTPAPVTTQELKAAGFDARFSVHQEHLKASEFGDYAAIQLSSPYMKSLLLQRNATFAVSVVPIAGENGRVAVAEVLVWPK